MTDFLISTEPGEHHHLMVKLTDGSVNPLIFISTNHRTMGMSHAMAEELLRALMAVLKGGFTRAISEDALEQEIRSAEARRSRSDSATNPSLRSSSANVTPQLGDL